jgi:hypothetical protein
VSQSTDTPPRCSIRRVIGVLVCSAPIVLLVASFAHWLVHRGSGMYGLAPAGVGLVVGGLNAYLSFARPWLYRLRHGSLAGYRFVSGFPLLGTVAAVWCGVVGFGEGLPAAVGLVALLLDTGGLPWFLVVTWRDTSFWDG